MSDIEKEKFRQIGIDLINEYRKQRGIRLLDWLVIDTPEESAFIRSIQLHEKTKQELRDVKQELADFRQEVSDAAEEATDIIDHWSGDRDGAKCLQDFIIPKPQPDALVAVLLELELSSDPEEGRHDAKWIRHKLDAAGFEIRKKNDDADN